jgi:hypothetical protein
MFKILHVLTARTALLGLVLAAIAPVSFGGKKENPAGKEAVERFLLGKYVVSAFNPGRGPSPGGVVVQVMKPGLESAPATAITPAFSYSNGRIKKLLATMALKDLAPIPYQSRLYITKIEARDNHVVFDLVTTEPYDGVWFKSALHVDLPKGYLDNPDMKAIDATIAEVLVIEQAQQNAGGGGGAPPPQQRQQRQQQAPAQQYNAPAPVNDPPPPPPPPAASVSDPPPPPAPPAAPVELKVGMTAAQVKSAMGNPTNIVKAGPKEIYFYTGIKVTLVNGKVTSID